MMATLSALYAWEEAQGSQSDPATFVDFGSDETTDGSDDEDQYIIVQDVSMTSKEEVIFRPESNKL